MPNFRPPCTEPELFLEDACLSLARFFDGVVVNLEEII